MRQINRRILAGSLDRCNVACDTMNMKTFKNNNWKQRDYECENIVACQSDKTMGPEWEPCGELILVDLTMLYREAGVDYWGYL